MFDPSKFVTETSRPLPVILLLDISSSMSGSKISELNTAIAEMLVTLTDAEKMDSEITLSVITFGGTAKMHIPFTNAAEIKWEDLVASGMTPLGEALTMSKEMIEDKDIIPPRAYRPTMVLVSDGQPNDEWEEPFKKFVNDGRSAKCDRMAMAIGSDAAEDMLKQFVEGTPNPLFYAKNRSALHEFFKRVTMSITTRMTSVDPNQVEELPPPIERTETSTGKDDDEWWR